MGHQGLLHVLLVAAHHRKFGGSVADTRCKGCIFYCQKFQDLTVALSIIGHTALMHILEADLKTRADATHDVAHKITVQMLTEYLLSPNSIERSDYRCIAQ